MGKNATLKVQTIFDYQRGELGLTLAPGRLHDCPLQRVDLPKGALRLADIAYFKVRVLESLNKGQVWWLSRLPARVDIWQNEQVVNIATWLAQHKQDILDVEVQLTAQRFTCRLIARRVPAKVAQQQRQQVIEAAKSRPHQLHPETLALCE